MTAGMMQLSPRGQAITQFLRLSVALLLLYALGLALSSLSALPALAASQGFADASQRFSDRSFDLFCLSSFVSAGIMMAGNAASAVALRRIVIAWRALALLTLLPSLFEPVAALDGALALALLLVVIWSMRSAAGSVFMRVWQLGILLSAICMAAPPLTQGDLVQALFALRLHLAYPLCALSIAFWLMPRLGLLRLDGSAAKLPSAALLLTIGGGLIAAADLGLPDAVALIAAPLVLVAYIMLSSHLARPLREPTQDKSLARHWLALAILCWLAAGGLMGALSMPSELNTVMRATDLGAAQEWLGAGVTLAIALAFINHTATALRGDNRRVTGYAPLWLVSFGLALAFIAQLCRGVAQFYLRQYAAAVNEAEALLPLTLILVACQLAVALGICGYALGFFVRGWRIRVVAP